jgi:general nucleoside transport system ATP-binding protein
MSTEAASRIILEVREISKRFGKVQALDNVSLAFRGGEIHTLLGENGAGKSTLMNIIYGLYQKDSGDLLVNGEVQEIAEPRDALRLGIGMVPQQFKLVPDMNVVQNVSLFMRDAGFLVRRKELRAKVQALSDLFGFGLENRLDTEIMDLSEGEKQKVEILKVLALGSKIILFDEATNVLAPNELDSFLKVIERLNREGYTILYITHRLQEALAVSNRISVFRKGKLVGTVPAEGASLGQLTTMMVGAEFTGSYATAGRVGGEPVLSVRGLSVFDERGLQAVRDVSFELYPGEIVGLSGIEGNGSNQLAEALMGLRAVQAGSVHFKGEDVTASACFARMKKGMNYIPGADTQVPEFTICKNSILDYPQRAPFARRGFLDWRAVGSHAEHIVSTYRVQTPSIQLATSKLSGGNRQRLALGRKMAVNTALMIAYHPTKGLDVNSQDFFYSQLAGMRDQGATVLFMGTDLDELFMICNRLMVIYRGEIVGTFNDLSGVSKFDIGVLMTGGATYATRDG